MDGWMKKKDVSERKEREKEDIAAAEVQMGELEDEARMRLSSLGHGFIQHKSRVHSAPPICWNSSHQQETISHKTTYFFQTDFQCFV